MSRKGSTSSLLYVVFPDGTKTRVPAGRVTVQLDSENQVDISLRGFEPFVMFLAIESRSGGSGLVDARAPDMCIRPKAGNSLLIGFGSHRIVDGRKWQPELLLKLETGDEIRLPASSHALQVTVDEKNHVDLNFGSDDAPFAIRVDIRKKQPRELYKSDRSLALTVQPAAASLVVIALHEDRAMRVD